MLFNVRNSWYVVRELDEVRRAVNLGKAIPVDDPYNMYFSPDGKSAIIVAEAMKRLDFRDPKTMQLVSGGPRAEITQVLENLASVAAAAGGSLDDIVKLTVYLTDLAHFPLVNEIMARYFKEPYPARAAIGVAALPRNSQVEIEAVLVLGQK